jgi:hypothetical protein
MKEVLGFPNYTLDENGVIYSRYIVGGRGSTKEEFTPLKQVLDHTGYYIVSLCNDGKKFKRSIHRLLAIHYLDNPEGKAHVNHIDGDKTNNDLSNLEWATPQENTRHAMALGLHDAKNKALQVPVSQCSVDGELIAEYESFKQAQKETGICWQNISKVCKGVRKSAGGFFWKYS